MPDPLVSTLLLFEDDPSNRAMLVAFFSKQGAKVIAAADGRDAIARIEAEQPDLLLLDVIMFTGTACPWTPSQTMTVKPKPLGWEGLLLGVLTLGILLL